MTTYEEAERQRESRWYEPPFPWATVLAWPLLWAVGYVTHKLHGSLLTDWEEDDVQT